MTTHKPKAKDPENMKYQIKSVFLGVVVNLLLANSAHAISSRPNGSLWIYKGLATDTAGLTFPATIERRYVSVDPANQVTTVEEVRVLTMPDGSQQTTTYTDNVSWRDEFEDEAGEWTFDHCISIWPTPGVKLRYQVGTQLFETCSLPITTDSYPPYASLNAKGDRSIRVALALVPAKVLGISFFDRASLRWVVKLEQYTPGPGPAIGSGRSSPGPLDTIRLTRHQTVWTSEWAYLFSSLAQALPDFAHYKTTGCTTPVGPCSVSLFVEDFRLDFLGTKRPGEPAVIESLFYAEVPETLPVLARLIREQGLLVPDWKYVVYGEGYGHAAGDFLYYLETHPRASRSHRDSFQMSFFEYSLADIRRSHPDNPEWWGLDRRTTNRRVLGPTVDLTTKQAVAVEELHFDLADLDFEKMKEHQRVLGWAVTDIDTDSYWIQAQNIKFRIRRATESEVRSVLKKVVFKLRHPSSLTASVPVAGQIGMRFEERSDKAVLALE